ncbi:putative HTLV-1-related endogenous sequence [Parus major]|uniref:putative HTLV-1-related endogenous sequence n=1 Tax=Parus major TaxID=9157 RepID=UPI000771128E|nr:putative HTLV-1-related endogenous sequence [Parus major]
MGAAGQRGPPTARPAARRRSAHLKPQCRHRGAAAAPRHREGVSMPSSPPAPGPGSRPGPPSQPQPRPPASGPGPRLRCWPELFAAAVLERRRTEAGEPGSVPAGPSVTPAVRGEGEGPPREEKGAEVLTPDSVAGPTQLAMQDGGSSAGPQGTQLQRRGSARGKVGKVLERSAVGHPPGSTTRPVLRGGFALPLGDTHAPACPALCRAWGSAPPVHALVSPASTE